MEIRIERGEPITGTVAEVRQAMDLHGPDVAVIHYLRQDIG